jgi:hypothetical protein
MAASNITRAEKAIPLQRRIEAGRDLGWYN